MLDNINVLSLHCVFHGIRFKVNNEDCGCRDDNLFFFIDFCVCKKRRLIVKQYGLQIFQQIDNE